MPTKLRFILQNRDGSKYTGPMAVAWLCKLSQKNALSMQYPIGWGELKKAEKLKFLAARLPKGYTLVVFREPRYCRKNRSLYVKTLHGEQPVIVVEEPRQRVAIDGIGLQYNWEVPNGNIRIPVPLPDWARDEEDEEDGPEFNPRPPVPPQPAVARPPVRQRRAGALNVDQFQQLRRARNARLREDI